MAYAEAVIVVVGTPAWDPGPPPAPAGRAAAVALAAARSGARVELMGRIGDDPAGDALLLALGRAGVGHVAVLRDPARPTSQLSSAALDDDAPIGSSVLDAAEPSVGEADDSGPRLEREDVVLGLGYLNAFDVLVVTDDAPAGVIPACVEAAAYAGARLVVAVRSERGVPDGLPEDATVLVAPDGDGESFARLLGRYAAALDGGAAPAAAFADSAGDGWEHPSA